MRRKLEDKLIKKYPQLFMDKDAPLTHSLMAFGCACGDGWYKLIDAACAEIMATNPPKDVRFVQIKEKFGGLRLYLTSGTDEIFEITWKYEEASYTVCEFCGSTKNVIQTQGWIHTLCSKCEKKYTSGYRPWLYRGFKGKLMYLKDRFAKWLRGKQK